MPLVMITLLKFIKAFKIKLSFTCAIIVFLRYFSSFYYEICRLIKTYRKNDIDQVPENILNKELYADTKLRSVINIHYHELVSSII